MPGIDTVHKIEHCKHLKLVKPLMNLIKTEIEDKYKIRIKNKVNSYDEKVIYSYTKQLKQ